MNSIGSLTPPASTSAFVAVPASKQATGLEDTDTKQDIFRAIEETSETNAGKASKNTVSPDNEASANRDKPQAEQQQQELAIIQDLASRDREVRAHEQAHASVGGKYAGAASFTYQRGPDGVSYAVGGEVSISAPRGGDPQSRLQAAEQIKRAALAPANPSAQDRNVAAQAGLTATQARAEIATQQSAERTELSEEKPVSESEDSATSETSSAANTTENEDSASTQAFINVTNASDVGAIFNQVA